MEDFDEVSCLGRGEAHGGIGSCEFRLVDEAQVGDGYVCLVVELDVSVCRSSLSAHVPQSFPFPSSFSLLLIIPPCSFL